MGLRLFCFLVGVASTSVRLAVIYCPPPGGLASAPLLRVVGASLACELTAVGSAPLSFPAGVLPQCPEPPDQFAPPAWIAGHNASDVLLGFFQSEVLLRLSLDSGAFTLPSPLHLGFTFDDAILPPGSSVLRGLTGAWYKTNPNCTNGCFSWASADLATGAVTPPSEATMLGIQETMGGSMWPAQEAGQVWFQGGMATNPAWKCAEGWCNFRVSVDSGELMEVASVMPPQVATHCYAPGSGSAPLAFAEDLDCGGGHPGEHDWGIARIHFENGSHSTVACLPAGVAVSGAPDISSFSDDGTLLAQASPWWFTDGPLHLLVFKATGELVLDSNLAALPGLLHPGQNASLISISAVGFVV